MTKPRRPLGEISGNIPKRRELTPYERGQIISAAKCGVKPGAISTELSLSRRTVRTTISSEPLRKNSASQPRSGRPRTYSEHDERLFLRVVRQFPKYTYAQLRAFTGLKLCNSTLQHILRRHYITTWRAKQRPALTKDVAKNCYL
jgi:transposase